MPAAAWKTLADQLKARRVQLDSRYKNLRLFGQERQINYRAAWDIEKGERDNYSDPQLLAIDVAYGLAPWSVRRYVTNGVPIEAAAGTPPIARPDPLERIANDPDLDPDLKSAILELAAKMAAEKHERSGNGY